MLLAVGRAGFTAAPISWDPEPSTGSAVLRPSPAYLVLPGLFSYRQGAALKPTAGDAIGDLANEAEPRKSVGATGFEPAT